MRSITWRAVKALFCAKADAADSKVNAAKR
jgi:hypothetical protein